MAIRVSFHPSPALLPRSSSPTSSRSHDAVAPLKLTNFAPKFRLFSRFPAGTRVRSYQHWRITPPPHQRLLVSSQSTNGRPSNGTMKDSNEPLPGYEFDQADMEPLGQGWDPWKQSSRYSNFKMQDADSSIRNQPGETSGREDVDMVSRKKVNKYGAVGNDGEEPYRLMPNGKKAYLDELDVLTLLDPPPFLKPMSTMSYNHAAFLWKKISDIPEERRHRLLDLLEPKHITAMWKMAELRYEDPELYLEDASRFLHNAPFGRPLQPVVWTGQVNEVPSIIGWFSRFKKAFFDTKNRELYGRLIAGGPLLEGLGRVLAPLYFQVRPVRTVPATKEQCDFAFSYEDGHFELRDSVPNGYPQPGRHPWPFGKDFFHYVRVVGPGVVVGQSWYGPPPTKDSKDPKKNPKEQGPRKYLGEFVLIQNYGKTSS